MYVIKVDGNVLHAPSLVDEGYITINPKADFKLNEASTLEFQVPDTNPSYNLIVPRKSVIELFDNDKLIFRGVANESKESFYRTKEVYCKSDLSFLEDSVCRPFEHRGTIAQYLTARLAEHNAQVDSFKMFTLGNVTVVDSNNYLYRYRETYNDLWTVLKEQLLDSYGGYFVTRTENGVNYLDYLADLTGTSTQTIEFGSNLIDFVKDITSNEMYTAIIPVGAEIEGQSTETTIKQKVTIKSVNNNKDYLIDSTASSLYGLIWKSVEFTDITTPAGLMTAARKVLQENIDLSLSLELTAFDLSLINKEVGGIYVGTNVRIISVPHSFDKTMLCTGIELDVVNPENNKYSFGATAKTSTEYIASTAQNATVAISAKQTADNASVVATETAQKVNDVIGDITTIYPVGSIYMSVNNTNPSTYFGGTWVEWGSGRVPVGVSTDTEFNTVEKTGGSKEMQKHYHKSLHWQTPTGGTFGLNNNPSGAAVSRITFTSNAQSTDGFVTGEEGTGTSGNLQPYITCYMWKRTA